MGAADGLARIVTATDGGQLAAVEVDVRRGLPSFAVLGMPDAKVRETRERVRAALLNSGFDFPLRRITVGLAPAQREPCDLAVAVGLLAVSGQVPPGLVAGRAVYGRLELSGEVRDGGWTSEAVAAAREAGCRPLALGALGQLRPQCERCGGPLAWTSETELHETVGMPPDEPEPG